MADGVVQDDERTLNNGEFCVSDRPLTEIQN